MGHAARDDEQGPPLLLLVMLIYCDEGRVCAVDCVGLRHTDTTTPKALRR